MHFHQDNDFELLQATHELVKQISRHCGTIEHYGILSRDCSHSGRVEFLSNRKHDELPFPKSLLDTPVRAPTMVTNILEAALLSKLLDMSNSVVWFCFPDERRTNFNFSSSGLPSDISSRIATRSKLTVDNNIYT